MQRNDTGTDGPSPELPDTEHVLVTPAALRDFTTRVFVAAGLPEVDASVVADAIVGANLHGVDSHGVMRIPLYVRRLTEGALNPRPAIKTVRHSGATAVIDADDALGHVAMSHAIDLAVNLAGAHGVGCVGVRNSSHFGAGRHYAQRALAHDVIAIISTNGPPVMAPAGGSTARLCNNPVVVGIPSGADSEIVLDTAMSVVAGGKIHLAAQEGRPIPDDWAITSNGSRTTDPVEALGGALLPLGYKGYGLAFVLEVLTGVLTNSAYGLGVAQHWDTSGEPAATRPSRVGQTAIVIDVSAFMDVDAFKRRVDDLVLQMRTSPTLPGVESVRVPGDMSLRIARERGAGGIPVSRPVYEELLATATALGVAAPVPARRASSEADQAAR